ncbi:TetR/AcrR family transcriptional regulator [Streptomyces buecherae]|uniref:TetR/AcrR family transcriptional regulator n=1 Tax=Streptomyces buecherae TaxID=2763006 RepID=UPI00364B363A
MTSQNAAAGRPRGRSADKRKAILGGALTVFARDGYARASVDAIAAEAGVSTRTIYNHFGDKAELFQATIRESATLAAEAQLAIIDRHLRKITDLEADLLDFGREFTAPMTGTHAAHFALVRQVHADAGHIPQAAIDVWQETGPLRVRRALAAYLRQWSEQGLLRTADPDRAAIHLMLLISAADPARPGLGTPTQEDVDDRIAAGIHVFLNGYRR